MKNNNDKTTKTIISACTLGIPCRWNAKEKFNDKAAKEFLKGSSIATCPEVLGGLSTPRPACEIVGGNGNDVLDGQAKVLDKNGNDFTKEFIAGANEVLKIVKKLEIKKAILKSKSPSCAVSQIFDGTFSDTKKPGMGVLTALLIKEGIEVEEV